MAGTTDLDRKLAGLCHQLAEALDKASQNSRNASSATSVIDFVESDSRGAGGSEEGVKLVRQARAAAGIVARTSGGNGTRTAAYRQLTDLKNSLRRRAAGGN